MTTEWLEYFRALLEKNSLRYMDAHTAMNDDETSHEWWKGERSIAAFERKLTVYEGNEGELIKVWGPNIQTQMESVRLDDDDKLVEAWKWLLEG